MVKKLIGMLILSVGVTTAANAFETVPHKVQVEALHSTKPTAAPEIDPASAISAFTLLAGGLAVIRARRAAGNK